MENNLIQTKSLPELMDNMDVFQMESVNKSISYGRQLQLQFKRLTNKRFSVTQIKGVHPSEGCNVRRIA